RRERAHAHQGEKGLDRRVVPHSPHGYRLARGPGSAADAANQRADRSPAYTQKRPSLTSWAPEDGGATTPPARLPQQDRRRALPRRDRPLRPPKVTGALFFARRRPPWHLDMWSPLSVTPTDSSPAISAGPHFCLRPNPWPTTPAALAAAFR